MSFTKIPNFSNCNIWLPQQQLNLVMKYYDTRRKSTPFLRFLSFVSFLVKCHTTNIFSNTTNSAHYCYAVIFHFYFYFLNRREGGKKIQ